jgi:hypothetical protein
MTAGYDCGHIVRVNLSIRSVRSRTQSGEAESVSRQVQSGSKQLSSLARDAGVR